VGSCRDTPTSGLPTPVLVGSPSEISHFLKRTEANTREAVATQATDEALLAVRTSVQGFVWTGSRISSATRISRLSRSSSRSIPTSNVFVSTIIRPTIKSRTSGYRMTSGFTLFRSSQVTSESSRTPTSQKVPQ